MKEINSDTIAEGIDRSLIGKLIFGSIIFFIVFVVAMFAGGILGIIGNYYNSDIQMVAPERDCFPLENLDCEIVVGNDTMSYEKMGGPICGYQEANAWNNYVRPLLQKDADDVNSKYNTNFVVKEMECE